MNKKNKIDINKLTKLLVENENIFNQRGLKIIGTVRIFLDSKGCIFTPDLFPTVNRSINIFTNIICSKLIKKENCEILDDSINYFINND